MDIQKIREAVKAGEPIPPRDVEELLDLLDWTNKFLELARMGTPYPMPVPMPYPVPVYPPPPPQPYRPWPYWEPIWINTTTTTTAGELTAWQTTKGD